MYLRTTPEVVYERIRQRARKEEKCVSLEYVKNVHKIHEEWLHDKVLFSLPAPVITIDGDQNLDEMLLQFEKCKDEIFSKQIYNEMNIRKTRFPQISPRPKLSASAAE